jgi:outer membrane protein assembly factor BamB
MKSLTRILSLALGIVVLSASSALAGNWPTWRGPDHDGVSKETGLPTTWSPDSNLAWSLKLPGQGSSTPAIWGDSIFVTCHDGKDLLLLHVGTDGKIRWQQKVGTAHGTAKQRVDEGSTIEASPSPATDGKHVYTFFSSGDCACYDFQGKKIWHFDVQERFGKFKIQFGLHSTPLLHNGHLYFQLFHEGYKLEDGQMPATVACVRTSDGAVVWKVGRKSDGKAECYHSYASPALWHSEKDSLLLVHGNDYCTAHRLNDGSEVFRVGDLNPKGRYNPTLRFVASPVASADLIVVPSAKNGPVVGVRPDAVGKVDTGSKYEVWRLKNGTPDVPSAVISNGLVYLCRENGDLICLDAKTGEELYKKPTHNQRHRASPVAADGKIYLTARDGTVSVVELGRTFKLLATNKLPDYINASPAISGGRIYLRGFQTLFAIGPK